MVMVAAWIAIGLYPIGIWVFCGLLLFKASPAILAGKETPLSRAIGFLHREYDADSFWWELIEMLRKFLLVGLFVRVQPGSIMQISIGLVVAAAYLCVTVAARTRDHMAERAAQVPPSILGRAEWSSCKQVHTRTARTTTSPSPRRSRFS